MLVKTQMKYDVYYYSERIRPLLKSFLLQDQQQNL